MFHYCFCHVGQTTETASCDSLRPRAYSRWVSSSLKWSEAGFWEKLKLVDVIRVVLDWPLEFKLLPEILHYILEVWVCKK